MKKKLLIVALMSVMAFSACTQSGEKAGKMEKGSSSSAAEEIKSARTEEQQPEEQQPEEQQPEEQQPKEQQPEEQQPEEAQQEEQEQQTEESADEDSYERGILTEDGWESAFWNLRFAPPEGLSMLSEEELNTAMGLGDEMLSENFNEQQVKYAQMMNVYEMMSTNLSGDANVVVTTEKLLAGGFSAEDYLKATKRTLTSVTTISYTVLEEGETFQIGDDTYGVMKVMGEGNGNVIYQDFYVKINGSRALAIAVTYTDDTLEMADEIIGSFEAL